MFERILIPLDGSPRAELILSQVAKILRRKDSEIILLRVVEIPEDGPYEAVREQERAAARHYIQELVRGVADRGVRARGRVVLGAAAETILDQAKREGASLVAMTTHGRGGLSRWLLGSVAEKVVRASTVPVLLLRSFRPTPLGDLQPAKAQELPFRRILVATDGSTAASAVLGPAGTFAQLFDAAVTVLHAELPLAIPGYAEMGIPPNLEPTPSEKDRATAPSAQRLGELGLAVKRRTIVGNPAEVILDVAHADEMDLMAMSTHGRSGFSRWFLGSVAERVLRHASVPLLLVRAGKEAKSRKSRAVKAAHLKA